VKIQVEFNPATVAEYRLIGYETRRLNREDFSNDEVDAGDIGAGHSVTAIYEVTPVGSPSVKVSDLRYQAGTHAKRASGHGDELAFVKLRYKRLGEDESMLIETPVTATDAGMPRQETLFAASVAAFGQLMRGSDHLEDWDYDDVAKLAQANRGPDTFGYRAEFLKLIRLAELAKR
jgi:Ca-activated chloride channel family protein